MHVVEISLIILQRITQFYAREIFLFVSTLTTNIGNVHYRTKIMELKIFYLHKLPKLTLANGHLKIFVTPGVPHLLLVVNTDCPFLEKVCKYHLYIGLLLKGSIPCEVNVTHTCAWTLLLHAFPSNKYRVEA